MPSRGTIDDDDIAGGDKWRDALRAAARSYRVVVCLVTERWLASSECFNEFMSARYLGRRIVPLILLTPDGKLDDHSSERDR